MKTLTGGIILALLAISVHTAHAGPALDTVKGHADKVLAVLRDPKAGEKKKHDTISSIADRMFDFQELSRRTLGVNWEKLTPEQQREFVLLYRHLLEDTYRDRITAYRDEDVKFLKEISLSDKTAEVQSLVIRRSGDVPINYRLILTKGEWRVYDVVIEGVSLVSNYRSQFKQILANEDVENLLDTLRKKVKKT